MSLSLNEQAAWSHALNLISTDTQRDRWRADPVVWVQERLGEEVWTKQAEIMRAVRDHPRVAVQSSHGVGKTYIASRIVGWILDTTDPGDFFVVSTAPTWSQVRAILWRYIGQMHGASKDPVTGRGGLPGYVTQQAEWKIGSELVGYGRKPADTDESGMQGLHGRVGVLAIIDEACGVPAQLWNAIDSLATTADSRTLALGNPDRTASKFYQVCTTEPGWHRVHVSSFDAPAMTGEKVGPALARGLVQRDWVLDKKVRWGENSPLYRIKVCGEFADDENSLIPSSWVADAQDRWRNWFDTWDGDSDAPWLHGSTEPSGPRVFGIDVAAQGDDETAIATRQGDVVFGVERYAKADTVAICDIVSRKLTHPGSMAVVDSIGVGQGVLDVLRRRQENVTPFIASAGTKMRDTTGTQTFPNLRSAAWWHMRELLDPANAPTLCLPPDDDLAEELSAPTWAPAAGGKLVVESKDSIRRRLDRSTDSADAVLHALWANTPTMGWEREQRASGPPRIRRWSSEFATGPEIHAEPSRRSRVRR